jgi:D-serine deaminase-like pyridoxal phosphate-dependent protein
MRRISVGWLGLDVLDHNIADIAAHAQPNGYALRPCFKVCKSVEIARRQVAAGALGVCCATLAEAEVSAAAGIPGVVLFSTGVTPDRLERVAAPNASGADFMVVTDDLGNVADLGKAARRSGRELALMDVNCSGVELRRDNPAPCGLALSASASVISSAGSSCRPARRHPQSGTRSRSSAPCLADRAALSGIRLRLRRHAGRHLAR